MILNLRLKLREEGENVRLWIKIRGNLGIKIWDIWIAVVIRYNILRG